MLLYSKKNFQIASFYFSDYPIEILLLNNNKKEVKFRQENLMRRSNVTQSEKFFSNIKQHVYNVYY